MSSVPQNKDELQAAISLAFEKILLDYSNVSSEFSRIKGVTGNVKGNEISVSDTLAYLIGWGKLVLKWVKLTSTNQAIDFPETGFIPIEIMN